MIINKRFSVNQDRHVTDKFNPANNGEGHFFKGDPEDDMHLRECVLRRRLSDLVDDLIINNNPIEKLPNGDEYQPQCEEAFSLWWALPNYSISPEYARHRVVTLAQVQRRT